MKIVTEKCMPIKTDWSDFSRILN